MVTGPTPEQAAHDSRTCPECQAMIKSGGYRFMDLMGHAGYVAFSARVPVPPWLEVREAAAQAALAAAGGWGGCDTFDAWADEHGFPAEDRGDSYGHGDLLAAYEGGALAAMQENAAAVAPAAAQEPVPRTDADRLLDWAARLIIAAAEGAGVSSGGWRTEQRDWLSAFNATPPAPPAPDARRALLDIIAELGGLDEPGPAADYIRMLAEYGLGESPHPDGDGIVIDVAVPPGVTVNGIPLEDL